MILKIRQQKRGGYVKMKKMTSKNKRKKTTKVKKIWERKRMLHRYERVTTAEGLKGMKIVLSVV